MAEICIDKNECIGCGLCRDTLPRIFGVDNMSFKCGLKSPEGLLESASIEVSIEEAENIKKLCKECPVQAIKLINHVQE